jgi:LysM repeat protein
MSSPGRHRKPPHFAQHAAPTTAQAVAGATAKVTPAAVVASALLTGQPAISAIATPANAAVSVMSVTRPAAAPAVWTRQQMADHIAAQLDDFSPPPATTQVTPALNTPYADQVVQDWRVHSTPRPPVPEHVTTDALVRPLLEASISYTVAPGDTLSSVAQKTLGDAGDWEQIFDANRSVLRNPNEIFPGQVLTIPGPGKASTTSGSKAAPATSTAMDTATTATDLSGTLSCAGLEELWDQAGGNPAHAFMAAEIAQAESGGNQFATGGVGERGYWQINPNHGPVLSTYNPAGNARAAIMLSADGSNWDAWTTFMTGAYAGKC